MKNSFTDPTTPLALSLTHPPNALKLSAILFPSSPNQPPWRFPSGPFSPNKLSKLVPKLPRTFTSNQSLNLVNSCFVLYSIYPKNPSSSCPSLPYIISSITLFAFPRTSDTISAGLLKILTTPSTIEFILLFTAFFNLPASSFCSNDFLLASISFSI